MLIILLDVFLTVLYARMDTGILSQPIARKSTWISVVSGTKESARSVRCSLIRKKKSIRLFTVCARREQMIP